MQALEKIGVLEHDEDKGGRRITQSGQRDLDRGFFFLGREFEVFSLGGGGSLSVGGGGLEAFMLTSGWGFRYCADDARGGAGG